MRFLLFPLLFLFISLSAQPVQTDHVEAQLHSEFDAIKPGIPFTVALRLKMDEHWHTYWRNAGDTGIPTVIKWDLPEGFTAGNIQWPEPERIIVSGLANYGYEGEVLLLTDIYPPNTLTEKNITIKAKSNWLVCKIECLPGKADLSLTLPVSGNPKPVDIWADRINDTRAELPVKNPAWNVNAYIENDTTFISLSTNSDFVYPDSVLFLPYNGGIFNNAADQHAKNEDGVITLSVPFDNFRTSTPDTIKGILISQTGWRGEDSETSLEINVPVGDKIITRSEESDNDNLALILLFAFLGGLILNLMPCVLPVLSLKIMGFVQQASSGKQEIYRHGLSFTAGVLISFWALAGVLLLLRAGGEKLGWGFQLQEPVFLLVLILLLFLFALNLFGVFEIGISLTQYGGAGAKSGGLGGSFLSGVTATVVATPCTAPFMGTALGYTLTQPALITILVFTALALGMAFPYLLLSIFPSWLKIVPKPGNWMVRFKQFMGFLMAATVIWLLWVLSTIKGTDALILTLLIILFASLAAWIYGNWGNIAVKKPVRYTAIIISLLLIILPAYYFGAHIKENNYSAATTINTDESNWKKFNPEEIDSLISQGEPVFIDFTATWCLTCQVNKKVALHDAEVVNAFKEKNVTTFIADWTKRDDVITDALAEFGRNSVPLYVLYNGKDSEPVILPEVLTPDIVKDYLNNLN